MSADWQIGDLAVCVTDGPCLGTPAWRPLVGAVYTVSFVDTGEDGDCILDFAEDPAPDDGSAWDAANFRKIRPDEREACEPEFVTLLKRSKRKVEA